MSTKFDPRRDSNGAFDPQNSDPQIHVLDRGKRFIIYDILLFLQCSGSLKFCHPLVQQSTDSLFVFLPLINSKTIFQTIYFGYYHNRKFNYCLVQTFFTSVVRCCRQGFRFLRTNPQKMFRGFLP